MAKFTRPYWLDVDPVYTSPAPESPVDEWASYNRDQLERLVPKFDRVILYLQARLDLNDYLGRPGGRDAGADELKALYYERAMLAVLLDSPDTTPEDLANAMARLMAARNGSIAAPSRNPYFEARDRFMYEQHLKGIKPDAIKMLLPGRGWDSITAAAVRTAVENEAIRQGRIYVPNPRGRPPKEK